MELISREIDKYQTMKYGERAMIYRDAYPAWEFSEGLLYRVPADWTSKG